MHISWHLPLFAVIPHHENRMARPGAGMPLVPLLLGQGRVDSVVRVAYEPCGRPGKPARKPAFVLLLTQLFQSWQAGIGHDGPRDCGNASAGGGSLT